MHPLVHLAIIWTSVFVAVGAAKKSRLTPVLYFMFIGFALANAGILPEESGPFIREFAELGIIFVMFALGFEETTDNFLKSIKKSWGIAFFGAIAPFGITYFIVYQIWSDTNIALMSSLAMTATAVSLTMVSLRSAGLHTSAVATRIMTSAVLDDIGALVMVAIVVPIAAGDGSLSAAGIAFTVGKAMLFFIVVTAVGAWIFPHRLKGWISRVPFVGDYGVKQLLTVDGGKHAALAILLLALVVGLIAVKFGFHPAVGAYMAGLILKEEYFDLPQDELADSMPTASNAYLETKTIVDSAAFSWIGPVFFVDLGAKLIFDLDTLIRIFPYAAILTIGIILFQVSSASIAARFTGGMNWPASLMIGFGMLGRAELAFVVIDIAYVQHSILHADAFFTLMITAFFLNVAVPLSIGWWRPYYLSAMSGDDA